LSEEGVRPESIRADFKSLLFFIRCVSILYH
jgi:hypothetical protein